MVDEDPPITKPALRMTVLSETIYNAMFQAPLHGAITSGHVARFVAEAVLREHCDLVMAAQVMDDMLLRGARDPDIDFFIDQAATVAKEDLVRSIRARRSVQKVVGPNGPLTRVTVALPVWKNLED